MSRSPRTRQRGKDTPQPHAACPGALLLAELCLLHSAARERRGQCPSTLHLPQAGTSPALEAPQAQLSATSCLRLPTLRDLISPLQQLPRLVPTVLRCLTSQPHSHPDSALSPTLTTLLAQPWPHLPPSPPRIEPDPLPAALSRLTTPRWLLGHSCPHSLPCACPLSPQAKIFICFAVPPCSSTSSSG